MLEMDWIYLKYIVFIAGVILLALIISIIFRKIANIFIQRYSSVLKSDPTNFSFLKNAIPFIVFSIAIFFIFLKIPFLRTLGTALFAGAGIIAAIVGFASQKAFANIISGIFILIFKPFRVGDTIELSNSKKGVVEEITLRHTIIREYENRRVIVPNNIISDDIIINSNISDEKIRKLIDFAISYNSDIDKAIGIIRDEAMKHPFTIDNRTHEEKAEGKPVVIIRVIKLADYSVNLRANVWSEGNDNAFILQCDLLKSVKQRFDREGVEIPFPYRSIVIKNEKEQP
jgi:small conductance mechanosensitive channel